MSESNYAFAGLAQIDNQVLNEICQIALETDRRRVEMSDIAEAVKHLGLDTSQLAESLQILHEDGYVNALRTMDGIQYVMVDLGNLVEFCEATRPDYAAVEKEVLAFIAGQGEATDAGLGMAQLPYPEGVPTVMADSILDKWESQGMFRVQQEWGAPQVLITHISPKLKRALPGL